MLRTIRATRYVTPLREGGSLPALIEADDLGLYVLKFRGAGQGPLALVAELVAGEIGRVLGIRIPELVFAEVDEVLGRNEPDPEIFDLLKASVGLNLAVDFLPGSVTFDIAAGDEPDPEVASRAVWFDAFVSNVDRTARNANILCWHRQMYFIDHGAALYFHHNWQNIEQMAHSPFRPIRDHILLRWATRLEAADESMRSKLNQDVLERILDAVPDAWLLPEPGITTPAEKRAAYVSYFLERLKAARTFVEEAQRGRAELV